MGPRNDFTNTVCRMRPVATAFWALKKPAERQVSRFTHPTLFSRGFMPKKAHKKKQAFKKNCRTHVKAGQINQADGSWVGR